MNSENLYHHQMLVLRQLCDMLSKMPSCLFFGDKNTGKKGILAALSTNYNICVLIDDHDPFRYKGFADYHINLRDVDLMTKVESIISEHEKDNILWIVNHYARYITEYHYLDDNKIGCSSTCIEIIKLSALIRTQRENDRVIFMSQGNHNANIASIRVMLILLGVLYGGTKESEEASLCEALEQNPNILSMLHPKVSNFISNRCGHYNTRCYILFHKIIKYQRCAYLPHHTSSCQLEPKCNIWHVDQSYDKQQQTVDNRDAWWILNYIRDATHFMIRNETFETSFINEYIDCSEHSKIFLFHQIIETFFMSNPVWSKRQCCDTAKPSGAMSITANPGEKLIIAMHVPSNIKSLEQSLVHDESLHPYVPQVFVVPTFLQEEKLRQWDEYNGKAVLILRMDFYYSENYQKIMRKYIWDKKGTAPRKLFYSPSESCNEIGGFIRMLSPIQAKSQTQINMLLGSMDELIILKGIHYLNCMLNEKNVVFDGLTGCYNEWSVVSNNANLHGTKINMNDIYVNFILGSVVEYQYLSYKTFLFKKYHDILVNNPKDKENNIFNSLPINIIDHIFLKSLQECPINT